jgi:hypothetical protein
MGRVSTEQQQNFTISGFDHATVNVTGKGDIYTGRQPSTRPPAARVQPEPQRDAGRPYDVCLSFAGEQRDYVQQVADGLVARGIAVFYDAYETANLWGRHLPQHLAWVYGEAARCCVVFASEAYARKVWTNHELRSAQARALTDYDGYLLPARFDDTPIPGIHAGIGYVDLRTLDPEDLVDLIAAKLAQ